MTEPLSASETTTLRTGISSRLRRGGLWIVAGRSLGMGTVFMITVVLAKFLPESDFASYIVTASVVTLTSIFAMFGLNYLMCRLVASCLASLSERSARTTAIRIGLVALFSILFCATIFLFASRWLFSALGAEELTIYAWAIVGWIVGLSISQIVAETFRGLHNLFAASILAGVSGGLMANSLLLIGICVLIRFDQLSYANVVIMAPCSFVPAILIGIAWLPFAWHRRENRPTQESTQSLTENGKARQLVAGGNSLTGIVREALPIMMLNLSAYGIDQSGQLISKGFGSDLDVNIFESVWKLGFLIIVPLTMFGLAAASTISEQYAVRNRSLLERVLQSVSTVSLLASFPLFLVLAFFGGPILSTLFQESYATGATALIILISVQMIRNWAGPCDVTLVMTGHQWWAFLCFVIASPLLFFGPWAIQNHGVLGITLVISAALLVSRLGHYFVCRVKLGVRSHANLSPAFLNALARKAINIPVTKLGKESLPDKAT